MERLMTERAGEVKERPESIDAPELPPQFSRSSCRETTTAADSARVVRVKSRRLGEVRRRSKLLAPERARRPGLRVLGDGLEEENVL